MSFGHVLHIQLGLGNGQLGKACFQLIQANILSPLERAKAQLGNPVPTRKPIAAPDPFTSSSGCLGKHAIVHFLCCWVSGSNYHEMIGRPKQAFDAPSGQVELNLMTLLQPLRCCHILSIDNIYIYIWFFYGLQHGARVVRRRRVLPCTTKDAKTL